MCTILKSTASCEAEDAFVCCPHAADRCKAISTSNNFSEVFCKTAANCFADGKKAYAWCPKAEYCEAANGGTVYCPKTKTGTTCIQKGGWCNPH